ncbi:glycosyltransferase family 2 protein [Winogradskyella sp. PG-2]|uniref:glycosyltransferase family 2 protein n=1 Tax=Winogradskyella sp. PG-2 TaxID=754409 RepID=UPI0004586DA5|nr:glycosyltransferase family 2 protein [Winogradskyella sp. PG-2]BAO76639.1 glycosyl transferase, group 2 family protein [Winogradskyella sp. PG-2]
MPFFSVIIPLYNKAEYISECLKSALNQTFKDYEIVIVNDGSTDNSVSIVETFSSEKIKLFHQDNQGASKARNNGSSFAKGTYIAFLDADDIWKPKHLESLKECIDFSPNAGIYATNYHIKHSEHAILPAKLDIDISQSKPLVVEDFFKASLQNTLVWTSAAAIKKDKFIDYDMFNPIYLSSQDLDLWIRVALKEVIVFHPESTMIYDNSIEGSLGKYEDNEARFILFNSFSKFEINNTYLKKYLDIKRYGLALRTKINGESQISKKTIKTIDFKNLNFKQKMLLSTPSVLLQLLNKIRPYLIKNPLYLRLFKN